MNCFSTIFLCCHSLCGAFSFISFNSHCPLLSKVLNPVTALRFQPGVLQQISPAQGQLYLSNFSDQGTPDQWKGEVQWSTKTLVVTEHRTSGSESTSRVAISVVTEHQTSGRERSTSPLAISAVMEHWTSGKERSAGPLAF